MKLLAASFAAAAVLATAAPAQTASFSDPANLRGEKVSPTNGRELPIDQGARGLQQMLRRLNTRASLMLIVAHPDDEDGGMLTLYSRGVGARVAVMTLNRGEGGQNAMTPDFEDALGLLRTQELLSAGRYSGVNQMFGTEVDFGFSKTKEEAFAKWTHQRVLYDVVRAVRLYHPLVIAAVFIGGVTDGHGQHQVSGEIAQEVFKAAGDPKVFPELTAEGILPWQPLKMYARVPSQSITAQGLFDYATNQYTPARFENYITGEVTTTAPSVDVVVHEGTPDPLLSAPGEAARSYVQFARIGLSMQKSQMGPGMRTPPSGAFDVSYHRYGSRLDAAHQKAKEDSFFEGIDTSLESLASPSSPKFLKAGLAELAEHIHAATEAFRPEDPAAIAPLLAAAWSKANSMVSLVEETDFTDGSKAEVVHELSVKRTQLNQALALALGLTLDATVHGAELPASSEPIVTAELHSSSPEDLHISRQWLQNAQGTELESGADRAQPPMVSARRSFTRTFKTDSDLTSTVTRPYFERKDIEAPVYTLRNPALRNAPASPPALVAWENVTYRGVPVRIGRVVHDGPQPLAFVPEISVALDREKQALTAGTTSLQVRVGAAHTPGATGTLRMKAPADWIVRPAVQPINDASTTFTVTAPAGMQKRAVLTAAATARTGGVYAEGYRTIGYGDLPRTLYFTPTTLHIMPMQLALPTHRRIGYLPGTGDATAEGLASVGLPSTTLTVADLTAARLAAFDTVVLGVRTYAAHPDLHGAPTQALLDYARNGGNIVLQYQTAEFDGSDAPFPLTLGRDAEKVVDETDAVKLLEPASPMLLAPNRLTPRDFDGWVAERGHGFLRTWDGHYTALTETADPGEDPQRGGLVTVQIGKGHWTYCAFALYRQLPEAVPGAYRIFANMLGLADTGRQ